jgi:hypothetical protein
VCGGVCVCVRVRACARMTEQAKTYEGSHLKRCLDLRKTPPTEQYELMGAAHSLVKWCALL